MRDSKWEVKFPPALERANGQAASRSSAIDRYEELDTEEDILAFLRKHRFLPSLRGAAAPLRDTLTANAFTPCATITTYRTTLLYSGATIVLDKTNFGYCVGEIEIMLSGEADASRAEQEIKRVASELGLRLDSGMMGKVLVYIKQHSSAHWSALEQSGLLQSKKIVQNVQNVQNVPIQSKL